MKSVYTFGNGKAEGRSDMKNLLGGKGANLAEMNLIGVPVPPGFTITTEVCTAYNKEGKDAVVKLIKADVEKAMAHVENLMGTKFGDAKNPLLVSVRSGARVSMPGMMDCKKIGKPSFCMGLLPPFRSNVRRCRIGNETQK